MKVAHVIGRFQPFHNGHKEMLDHALLIADRVIVVLGDTGCAPDHRDPWSVGERIVMIQACYPDCHRLTFVCVEDIPYDDEAWASRVHGAVAAASPAAACENLLVGFHKDASSFYLDMFPTWKLAEVGAKMVGGATLDATEIRRRLYTNEGIWWAIKQDVPPAVFEIMSRIGADRRQRLAAEYFASCAARAEWDCEASRKYGGHIGVAVDAVITCAQHLLLVERGGDIGNGTYALPGGFVNPTERLARAALRELHEETGLDLLHLAGDLQTPGAMVAFDHPRRSSRGRVITHALGWRLSGTPADHPVVGADDAKRAFWLPFSELAEAKRRFFSDHWHIAQHFIN